MTYGTEKTDIEIGKQFMIIQFPANKSNMLTELIVTEKNMYM